MVEVMEEERIGHLIESYYGATAEDFLLTHGKISSPTLHDRKLTAEQATVVLNALKKLGFKLEFDENKISQLVDLQVRLENCCPTTKKSKVRDEIWNIDDLNLLAKAMTSEFAGTLLMSDKEFAKQQETRS
jgi:hypothetical protein